MSRYLGAAVLFFALTATPMRAAETTTQQQALLATLQQIISEHLGIDSCTLAAEDSETAYIVQIYCPATAMPRILGQSGMLLRSLKIIFNDLYLDQQQRQLGEDFVWDKAKKMHLRFVSKE